MDILDEIAEDTFSSNKPEEVDSVEEIEEKPIEIDPDKLLEEEIKQHLVKNGKKLPQHKCSRCGNNLGSVDQWFNYGIKAVKFGYTMIPQPLCKNCFKEFEDFMNAFEVKK